MSGSQEDTEGGRTGEAPTSGKVSGSEEVVGFREICSVQKARRECELQKSEKGTFAKVFRKNVSN